MSKLRDVVEDLRLIVPIANLGREGRPVISGDPAYERIVALVSSIVDDPELQILTAPELRAVKTFEITVARAVEMEPTMARKHIGAVWIGEAKQAFLKLSVGEDLQAAMHLLMAGGIG